MAQLDRPALHAEIDGRFPDNSTALITPALTRAFLHNLVDSAATVGEALRDVHTFRFRTQAEAAGQFGGETLDQLQGSALYTYARIKVEFWRDNPADLSSPTRFAERVAVFDERDKPDYWGWRTSGGAAKNAGRIGLRLVALEDPAATGVLQYDPQKAVMQNQLRYHTDSQGAFFAQARQNMLSPVPAPVRGVTTAYWQPTDPPPVPGGTSYSDAQARAAQLNQIGSGDTIRFDADKDWPDRSVGTYVLDTTGAVPKAGVLVRFLAGSSAPTIPPTGFALAGGVWTPGKINSYAFYVLPDKTIEYNIASY